MRKNILLLCLCLIHFALGAPSDGSLVVSSTEPSKENGTAVTDTSPIPPKIYEMRITANITNRFAKTLVISKVKNPSQIAKEATFIVVLPEKAFISEFVMEIGGKRYKAYVKEKEEAKKIYEQAVASGQSAAQVAVSARDSNKFTVSVNMEAEGKAIFFLTYEELLERKNNQYELVLNIHPGQLVDNLNVQVNINESRTVRFLKTPSPRSGNEISTNQDKLERSADIHVFNSKSALVKFTPDTEKQKQLAKELGTKESDGFSGQFIVQYDVERESEGGEILLEDGYFVHFFAPQDLEPLPKHVVFVLDTSGSMGGNKIDQLKDAMISILAQLRENDIFSIVEFNSNAQVWNVLSETATSISYDNEEKIKENPFSMLKNLDLPSPSVANKENIAKAQNFIKQIQVGNTTNMLEGLEVGFFLVKRQQEDIANKTNILQPIIIALTDGQPDQKPEEIIKLITKLNMDNNKSPLFTLSFGQGANKDFLRKIALKNFGLSRHIYEAADSSLQLQNFYMQISSPLLNNVDFKYTSDADMVTKTNFPIYFGSSELVIAGRYRGNTSLGFVRSFGSSGHLELQPSIARAVAPLERLWAYLTVKQTLEERDSTDNNTELTRKALDLALKYSFVTDVSSLVVVKPNETSAINIEEAVGSPISKSGMGRKGGRRAKSRSRSNSGWPAPIAARIITERLKMELPWLATFLSSNGSLSLPQGVYKLGSEAVVGTFPECPKTPLNNTQTGQCTLLRDCLEVLFTLTDIQVYQQYFCTVENKYAGVCCPKKQTM